MSTNNLESQLENVSRGCLPSHPGSHLLQDKIHPPCQRGRPALVLRVSLHQPLYPLHPPPVTRHGQGTGDHWNACASSSDTAWVLLCSLSRTSFPAWPPGCHFLQFSRHLKVNSILELLAGPHPSSGSLRVISRGPWSLVYHNRGIDQTVADLLVSLLICELLDGRN